MRDISGAEFRFAKTLTLPFFGSGMVELPPGGSKRVKNSRKMQMVFFVFFGRVTVDVGTPTTSFSIGKGGMWQVPRGKIFFSFFFIFFPVNITVSFYKRSTRVTFLRHGSVLEHFSGIYSASLRLFRWGPPKNTCSSGVQLQTSTVSVSRSAGYL